MYVIELCLANQLKFIPTIKTVKPTYIAKIITQVCIHPMYAHQSKEFITKISKHLLECEIYTYDMILI